MLGDGGEVGVQQQAVAVADRTTHEAVQPLEGTALVGVEVALRMVDDGAPARRSACTRSAACWAMIPLGR